MKRICGSYLAVTVVLSEPCVRLREKRVASVVKNRLEGAIWPFRL